MTIDVHHDVQQRAVLDRLIRAKGLEAHALFLVTGEGRDLPSGLEETSGYAIDPEGRVFRFWMGADPVTGTPALTTWRRVEPKPYWERKGEYRRARAAVGLPT